MAHRYQPAPVGSLARVRVWSNSGGTTPAVLTTLSGQPLRSNDPHTAQPVDGLLIADDHGVLPEFLSASNPVYVGATGSAVRLDPVGESDGSEVSALQVYGTPGDGKVPAWNVTTKRLEWATPSAASGGVRLVDLGVVAFADLTANGQTTVFTPAAGEFVWGLMVRDVFYIDAGSWMVQVGTELDLIDISTEIGMAGFDTGMAWDGFRSIFQSSELDGVLAGSGAHLRGHMVELSSDPIIARAAVGPNVVVVDPIGVWRANHVYAGGELISEVDPGSSVGYVWQASAGTSGGSKPAFGDYTSSPVTDNDVTWSEIDYAASTGSIHVYALVATPSAP